MSKQIPFAEFWWTNSLDDLHGQKEQVTTHSRIAAAASGLSNLAKVFTYSNVLL